MTEPAPPRLNRIVVAVDGSPESVYALDLAAMIGAGHRAAITIVHVRHLPFAFGLGPEGSIEYAQAESEIDAAIKADATTRLAAYAGTWSVSVRSGHVTQELLSAADEVDADLVIVGHRSHGTIRDGLLGSVAASTVHHSHRSVLVAVGPQQ